MSRKFKLWLYDNWMKVAIACFAAGTIILFLWGLWAFLTIESFYRHMMVAGIPGQLYLAAASAFLFVYLYANLFTNQLSGLRRKGKVKSEKVNVRMSDVIGLDNAKREAMEVVELLKDRAKLKAIGGQIVKGLMLFGAPDTGKTMLAKAIATEAGVPFLSMAGSEFVEVFVGVGSSRIRQLFRKARLLAYTYGACIIFIDEVDALGQSRKFSFFGSSESDSTLNQLLVEMDGLGDTDENVVVIGATNASETVLDPALLRPGRFDRHIYIDRPNLKERVDLFRYYLKKVKHDPDIDIGRLGRRCVHKSPADIMNIVKESALIALRDKRETVNYNDLSKAIERIDLGIIHHLNLTPEEKEAVAYHETGHLMVLYQLHPTDDVFKASIVARGGTLGVVYHHPREERHTATRDKLLADIKVALGGYLAEKIKYGVTSTGVAADFTNAMHNAHKMVWEYGMGTNGFVGDYSYIVRGYFGKDVLSDSMKDALNKETHTILAQCAKEVEAFLRRDWPLVERFVQELIKREELEYDEIHAIFAEFGKARAQVPIQTVKLEDNAGGLPAPQAASAPGLVGGELQPPPSS
jgi:cell division protease FtsH